MDILNNEFLLFIGCAQQNQLRYMLNGGYAVNFYGFSRNTNDLDIWLAPTNENKEKFIQTLMCMKYSEEEVSPLNDEDFTKHFVGTIGSADSKMDVLTIVHKDLEYLEAEKHKSSHEIQPGVFVNIDPYEYLKEMKLRSSRAKNLWDIARLEEIRNINNHF